MVDQVWISGVMSNGELGNKLGLRHKWFGEPWEAPYLYHHVPKRNEKVFAAVLKHAAGQTLKREEMPEASAVYDMSLFERVKDVLFIGAFLGVKGRVAEVLSNSISVRAAGSSPTPSTRRTRRRRCRARSMSSISGGGRTVSFQRRAPISKTSAPSVRRAGSFGRSTLSRTVTSRFRLRRWQGPISGCARASKAASS